MILLRPVAVVPLPPVDPVVCGSVVLWCGAILLGRWHHDSADWRRWPWLAVAGGGRFLPALLLLWRSLATAGLLGSGGGFLREV